MADDTPGPTPTEGVVVDPHARAVVDAFCEACRAGDEAAARTCTTDDGWAQARGLFRQVVKKGLAIDAFGAARRVGSRSVVRAVLSRPDKKRPLGDLWLLIEHTVPAAIVGVVKPHAVASLFLRGELSGSTTPEELPASPRAEEWGAWLTAEVVMGAVPPGLPAELTRHLTAGKSVETAGSAELAVAGRAAVGLALDNGDTLWVVLDRDDKPVRLGYRLSFDLLLSGVELPFPQASDTVPDDGVVGEEVSGVERDDRIRHTVAAAIRELGVDRLPPTDERRVAARQMQAMVDQALAARAAEDPATPKPFSLPPRVQAAVEEYMVQEVAAGRLKPGEIGVDEAFLRAHGAGLTGALFQGFVAQAAPQGLSLSVPVPAGEGQDGPQSVTLKVDFAGLFSKLLQASQAKGQSGED